MRADALPIMWATAADVLNRLPAFAWIVGGPVPNQQCPDRASCSRRSVLLSHSNGLPTGSMWVPMISVLALVVAAEDADADAVEAESDHPCTEGRHPAKVEWIGPTKQRTPL